jgi:2-polyprenyl-3-methyl-5-hydroxy-6-metoxy-1,4-benzoquinol methylase
MTQKNGQPWHEEDEFWDSFGQVMFDEQRRALAPAEVQRLIGLLGLRPGQHVCDLCCGIGRHSIELARRGLTVTGVDRTAGYLDTARRRAGEKGLTIEFVQADMREFCRPGAFDTVANMFTSFGYFEDAADDGRVLRNAYASLRPGGQLLVDTVGKEIVARIFRPREADRIDGCILIQERTICDDWNRIDNVWTLIKEGQPYEWRFAHRLYAATELRALFEAAGFRRVRAYGSLAGTPYDERAERLIIVGQK